VGHAPVAQEDVAQVHAPHPGIEEPGRVAVIAVDQFVRPHVGQLETLAVDDAQVHERLGPTVEQVEQLFQFLDVAELIQGGRLDQHLEHGRPLGQKEADGVRAVESQTAQGFRLGVFLRVGQVEIDARPEDIQGREGDENGRGDHSPGQFGKGLFHGDSPWVRASRFRSSIFFWRSRRASWASWIL